MARSQGEGLQEDGVAAVGDHAGLLHVPGIAVREDANLGTGQKERLIGQKGGLIHFAIPCKNEPMQLYIP